MFEIGARFGRAVVGTLARIDGHPCAVLGTDGRFDGAGFTMEAAAKLCPVRRPRRHVPPAGRLPRGQPRRDDRHSPPSRPARCAPAAARCRPSTRRGSRGRRSSCVAASASAARRIATRPATRSRRLAVGELGLAAAGGRRRGRLQAGHRGVARPEAGARRAARPPAGRALAVPHRRELPRRGHHRSGRHAAGAHPLDPHRLPHARRRVRSGPRAARSDPDRSRPLAHSIQRNERSGLP